MPSASPTRVLRTRDVRIRSEWERVSGQEMTALACGEYRVDPQGSRWAN